MLYQIEEIQTRKRKKLVIVYIVILLLVLLVAIGLGMFTAKKVKQGKMNDNHIFSTIDNNMLEGKQNTTEKQSQNQEITDKQNTIEEQIKVEYPSSESDFSNFVKNVGNIYNGTEGKRVFLTFDDGPSKAVTPHILDTLKEHNIKATFFLLGSRVKLNPDLVKREYEEGHYIANHGYSHQYSKIYASSNDVIKEYNRTEQEIKKALGNTNYSSHLFRFPGGSIGGAYSKIKKEAKQELKKQQIAYLDWNALTSDAAGANTKEKIMSNLKKTVGNYNNVVILMHDAPDKILTYETLDEVINYLENKGYAFKNMYDLM